MDPKSLKDPEFEEGITIKRQPSSTRKEKRMIIHTAKIVVGTLKYRRILGFENVALPADVPQSYMAGYPEVRADLPHGGEVTSIVIYNRENGSDGTLKKGDKLSEIEYQILLTVIKKAGARLTQIRRDIRKQQKNWACPHVVDVI